MDSFEWGIVLGALTFLAVAVPAVRLLAAGDILPAGNDWENEDDEPDQSYLDSVAPELPLQRFPGQPALLPDNDVIDATWRRLPALLERRD